MKDVKTVTPPVPSTSTNREYKDSLFRTLFKTKEHFLELYNAVKGTNYGEDTLMRETTIEDALYLKLKNDVSFEIDGKLVVFMEHQSTMNYNIAIRMLAYAWETYRPMFDPKEVYYPQKIKLPRPEFYVLYNGKRKMPPKHTVRLSDHFPPCADNSPPMLDLVVDIYDININGNPDLLRKSQTLSHYETFIELVRDYERSHSRNEAVKLAVEDCLKRGILTEFLKTHGLEVIDMLSILNVELTDDEVRESYRAYYTGVGMEKGKKEGREEGREEVVAMIEKGVSLDEIKRMISEKQISTKVWTPIP